MKRSKNTSYNESTDIAPDWFEISYMGYDVDTDGDGLKAIAGLPGYRKDFSHRFARKIL